MRSTLALPPPLVAGGDPHLPHPSVPGECCPDCIRTNCNLLTTMGIHSESKQHPVL